MTRFVPLTTTDGLVAAVDAHRVHEIVQCDGFVRVYRTDTESFVDVPGTVAELCAMLSDPPAGAVRFVDCGMISVNAAAVVAIEDGSAEYAALTLRGRKNPVYVRGSRRDVIAKLEGRAS
mgnify:CR=1 FL=1